MTTVPNQAHASAPDLTLSVPSGTRPYLDVAGVGKVYPGNVQALDEISFSVDKGEFIVLLGPSGCGKSTLLRIIAGLRKPTSGSVFIANTLVTRPQGIGIVFQQPALLPWRTALQNVLLAPQLAGLKTKSFVDRAHELLDSVGLRGFENKLPSELSGGMQQRVSICRALINDPDILLMDEPFGALDALTRDEMALQLLEVWAASQEKKTVLFVTHSISEAVFLADRIVVMTVRPGSIASISRSVLPRPRTVSMRGNVDFANQTLALFQQLGASGSGNKGD